METSLQSEATMPPELANPPATASSAAEATDRPNHNLRVLVYLSVVKLLKKCGADPARDQENWVPHIRLLVERSMEGLPESPEFKLKDKYVKYVYQPVLEVLQKTYSAQRLKSLVLARDQTVVATIVKSLHVSIRKFLSVQAGQGYYGLTWKDIAKIVGVTVGFVLCIALVFII